MPDVIFGLDPMWMSTALLVVVYALIITEWINRAVIALVGAGLMILFGVLDQAEAVRGIDFDTIALLTGTMIIVSISAKSGVFQSLAILSAQIARAEPWRVLPVAAPPAPLARWAGSARAAGPAALARWARLARPAGSAARPAGSAARWL